MSLGTDILYLLEAEPGLTCGEIADRLREDDAKVRTNLTRLLPPFVTRDWFGRWFLREQIEPSPPAAQDPSVLQVSIREPVENNEEESTAEDDRNSRSLSRLLATWVRDGQRWAVSEGHAASLGDLLSAPLESLPWDLARRREALYQWATDNADVTPEDPFEPISRWFRGLDERSQTILVRRTLAFNRGELLEDLAHEFGVSRERIRQVEKGLKENLELLATSWEWQAPIWRAHSLQRRAGLTCRADYQEVASCFEGLEVPSPTHQAVVHGVLWRLAGPYEQAEDDWLVRDPGALNRLRERLGAETESGRYHTLAEAAQVAEEAGLRSVFFVDWLAKEARLRNLDERVVPWPPHIGDRIEIVLRLRGEPMTAEALLSALGEGTDPRSLRSRLSGDDRFVRAGRTEWALCSWGLPQYHGLAAEITRCLENADSPLGVDALAADFRDRFGSAESSVRALCGAPRFIVEGGEVRLRRQDNPYVVDKDVSAAPGVFLAGPTSVCLVLEVDQQLLRGSGRAVPEPLAAALKLKPGMDREFATESFPVRLSWPDTSISGPAVGSLRLHAERVEAGQGDLLRLILDRETRQASVMRIATADLHNAGIVERVQMLTGIDVNDAAPGLHAVLAKAVGTSSPELRRVLERRGDQWLLPVLPREVASDGLREALVELAQFLDK